MSALIDLLHRPSADVTRSLHAAGPRVERRTCLSTRAWGDTIRSPAQNDAHNIQQNTKINVPHVAFASFVKAAPHAGRRRYAADHTMR
jgi:hypothetical protein